jgi:hypothetical protein
MHRLRRAILAIAGCSILFSGGMAAANVGSLELPDAQYEFVSFENLDGWSADRQAQVFAGFRRSCEVLLKRKEAGLSACAGAARKDFR